MVYFFFHGFFMRIGLIMAKCGAFLACIKKYTQQFYLSHVLTSYLHCFSCSDCQVYPLKSRITARRRANPGQSLQRLPSLTPEIMNRCSRGVVAFCRRNHSPLPQRRLESDADLVAATAVAGVTILLCGSEEWNRTRTSLPLRLL